eukprot:scaffold143851_cov90-Phaeocystis_antarctica.AAC.2
MSPPTRVLPRAPPQASTAPTRRSRSTASAAPARRHATPACYRRCFATSPTCTCTRACTPTHAAQAWHAPTPAPSFCLLAAGACHAAFRLRDARFGR